MSDTALEDQERERKPAEREPQHDIAPEHEKEAVYMPLEAVPPKIKWTPAKTKKVKEQI